MSPVSIDCPRDARTTTRVCKDVAERCHSALPTAVGRGNACPDEINERLRQAAEELVPTLALIDETLWFKRHDCGFKRRSTVALKDGALVSSFAKPLKK